MNLIAKDKGSTGVRVESEAVEAGGGKHFISDNPLSFLNTGHKAFYIEGDTHLLSVCFFPD